jgi:hypothetical protein
LDDLRKEITVLQTYCSTDYIFAKVNWKHFGILFAFLPVPLLTLKLHAPFAFEDVLRANALSDGIGSQSRQYAFGTLLLRF